MALVRTTTPSRWRASSAAWRWWEVRVWAESSVVERVIDVIDGGGGTGMSVSAIVDVAVL